MRISVDASKCTGCGGCALICYFHRAQVFNPAKTRIKVISLDYLGFSNPVVCQQCKKPPCIEACPVGALGKTDIGTILVKEEKCNGCRLCVEGCIIGAINFDEGRGLPLICDLCGGKSVCVEWCPSGALTLNSSKRSKGKKELGYTISKAKPFLQKWQIPEDALEWYKKFA